MKNEEYFKSIKKEIDFIYLDIDGTNVEKKERLQLILKNLNSDTDITDYHKDLEIYINLKINNLGALTEVEYDLIQDYQKIFLNDEEVNKIIETLNYKKNIIIEGGLGTGKSFLAKKLPFLKTKKECDSRIEMIYMHNSYCYENFLQGYDKNNKLFNGIFYDFCKTAQKNRHEDYFFIIDNINKENIEKIMGEALFLLDKRKRNPEDSIILPYSKEKFYVPENVYLIATINNLASDSLSISPFLSRRFSTITLKPGYKHPKFKEYLLKQSLSKKLIDKIIATMTKINDYILKNENLGDDYLIGHSYFTSFDKNFDELDWYNIVIKTEIIPLLKLYFEDYDKIISKLKLI